MDILNLEKLQLFLVIVLPGFVAIRVFDLFSPPEKRDFGNSIIEAVVYGLVNFALWSWLFVSVSIETARQNPLAYSGIFAGTCIVSPAAIAFAVTRIRRLPVVCQYLGEITPSAWNDFFDRRRECWVICHLKDGKKIAGLFSKNSFATVYPRKQELYLEQTCYVDKVGKISGIVPGTAGTIVRHDDCLLIEFLDVER